MALRAVRLLSPILLGVLALGATLSAGAADNCEFLKSLKNNKKQTIVAYGTSLTEQGEWVKQLDSALNTQFKGLAVVVNSGKSSKWSEWGEQNLDELVLAKNPDAVFIEFAVNDSVTRFNCPVDVAKTNLCSMIDRILQKNPKCEIILMTMTPADACPEGELCPRENIAEYYQMYRDVAAERKLILVDNYKSWLELQAKNKDLFTKYVPDTIHPTGAGCEEIVTPAILKAIGFRNLKQISFTETVSDDKKLNIRDCKIPLLNGSITYSTFKKADAEPGELGACIRMNFGATGFNGGWDNSSFFKVFYQEEWKKDILQVTEAESVTLTHFDGGLVVDFVWQIKEGSPEGKISLRFIQFASMPEWLFARLKTETIELNDCKVCFSARPGTPWLPAGGERWIATPTQHYQVEPKAFDISPDQNAVAFFSKVQFEDYGNLFVYESAKYEKLGCTPQHGFYLKPNPGAGDLHFGFGYFNKKPGAETVARFLSEESKTIFAQMGKIDWNPKLDYSEFESDAKDVEKMVSAAGDAKYGVELKRITKKFDEGKTKGDAGECAQALLELNQFRVDVAKAAQAPAK